MIKSIFAFFIKLWSIEYFDINRESAPLFDLSKLEGPSKIAQVLAREGIVALGGVNQVLQIIEKSNSILPSPYPAFATRVKGTVKKIASDSTYTIKNKYMTELDDKVKQYVDHFLHLNESLP